MSNRYSIPARDFWRTPAWLFDLLHDEFRFTLDAAATGDDARCPRYLSPDEDALEGDWPLVQRPDGWAAAFLNPPYSNAGGGLLAWVQACIRNADHQVVVLVTPASAASTWARLLRARASEVRHPSRRIAFDPPPGVRRSSPRHESMVSIFRPGHAGPALELFWDVDSHRPVQADESLAFTNAENADPDVHEP